MVRRKKSRPGQAAAALGGKAQPSALAFQGTIVSGSAASIFVDGGSGKGKSSSSSSASSGNGHRRLDRGDRGGKGGSDSSRPRRRKLPDFMTPEKRAAGLRVKQAAGRSPGPYGAWEPMKPYLAPMRPNGAQTYSPRAPWGLMGPHG